MPRGSGRAGPGVRTVKKKKTLLYDDARIRGVRIRASKPLYEEIMMTCGSGSADPNVKPLYEKS